MAQNPFFTRLQERGLLKISGVDRKSLLQSLITNDIYHLDTTPSLYACLLTPQGKFLFDFFITEENDTLILDCEGGERLNELKKILQMYALREDIKIEIQDNITIYAGLFNCCGTSDPRSNEIGYRSFTKPESTPESSFEVWDKHRIKLCIPDGSRDMIPGKSTLLENHIDKLNGISFEKGCYVGQELTARMYYRGLTKKHLRTVKPEELELDQLPKFGTQLKKDGKTIGEMRSSSGDIGLALIKKDAF